MTLTENLGFEKDDKIVITHVDDMGSSHAANVAAFKCLEFGIASCGSVIAPAAWLMEVVHEYRQNRKMDLGIHLTLTSEYSNSRWRPISSVDSETGLLDEEGYLWKTTEQAVASVDPEAAMEEMRAQVELVIQNGVDITHIDMHMGTVIYPKFVQGYLSIAREYQIPAFLPRVTREQLVALGLGEYADFFVNWMKKIEESGFPLVDHFIIETLGESDDKIAFYARSFDSLEPGLTHLLFHPARMSPELEVITSDSRARHQDYQAFTDPKLKEHVEETGVKIIGYREVRDYYRENL
ncbi:MAG: polysaccharide deacetylase family protein [Candidatus Hodarchaeales archaeon]|jgi:predicted glycoside hydrolase/deacetylase ChbG (UPF0249 family)